MEMDLKNIQWKEFNLNEIFPSIQRGKRLKKDDHKTGNQPYVSSSALNNGIDGFVGNTEKVRKFKKCLTIANSGSVGATFFQPFSFVASDHITKLENKEFSKNFYLFISSIAKRLSEKYSFNREINDNRIQREKILLPINSKGEPDYSFMEQYMRRKEQEKIDKFQNYISKKIDQVKDFKEVEPLNQKEWGEFFIEDVAQIISGRDIYESERIKGNIPYVSATANNNGIGYFVGNANETLEENCLSVNRNGSVGFSFYHQYKALFSNDCRKLRLKNNSPFVGKFISRIITGQKEKYGYGYKMGTGRMKRQKILLPTDKKGQPDYEYMENYIKKLEHQKLTNYLTRKTGNIKLTKSQS
jgi:hypothetical protein